MEPILSKDEIAELLSAVHHGQVEIDPADEESPQGKRQISQLNLFKSQGPENWKLPNFDLVLDAFGHNFATSLSNRLQRATNITLTGFQSMTFEALLQKLSGRGAIGIVELEPLRGNTLVVFNEQISYALVELVLGGSAKVSNIPQRPMTAIELNVIHDVVADSCPDLAKSFTQIQTVEAHLVKIESNLRLLSHISQDAGVLVAHYQTSVDEAEGEITLVLPHASLEPLMEKYRENSSLPMSTLRTNQWQKAVLDELQMMNIEVQAQLAQISLRVRDILNFEVGDVIDLNCDPDSPLKLLV